MGRPRKALHEVQGHRTRAELADRVAEEAERVAAQAEDDLIESLPGRFPPSAPGIPTLSHEIREQYGVSVLAYMGVRKKLVDRGTAQLEDTALICLYICAHNAGQYRLAQAIDQMVADRPVCEMPPLSPTDPQRMLDYWEKNGTWK